jgi:hypothetical protein
MAKKKRVGKKPAAAANGTGKPNKTAAVREYLKANPSAKAKDVIEALKAKGIEISANYVSMIKSKTLAKASRKKSGVAKADVSSRGQLEAALTLARACRWDFEAARHFLEMIEKVHQGLR